MTEFKKRRVVLVPPDGGYGWIIVIACAICNFIVIPLMQSFGLIFKDKFSEMGLSAAAGSFIINLNSSFGMLTAFFNGALLNYFGYRKIAFASAALLTVGIILTAYATTFVHFVISYGIISSVGMMMGTSSYSLAVNTYFKKRKGKAIGISMTLTGLGPIVIPQIVNFLMMEHTIEGVTLILGAISAHTFVSAAMLQPVKYHMKEEIVEEYLDSPEEEKMLAKNPEDVEKVLNEKLIRPPVKYTRSHSLVENHILRKHKDNLKGSLMDIDIDHQPLTFYGLGSALGESVYSLNILFGGGSRKMSLVSNTGTVEDIKRRKMSETSYKNINSHRRLTIVEDDLENGGEALNKESTVLEKLESKESLLKKILQNISVALDLHLLKDPIYINIMLGMSLAVFAEITFSVLTAFILADFGLSTDRIATFMSVTGITDIIFRFLAPFLGDLLKKTPRQMYMLSLLMLIAMRFLLILVSNYYVILCVAAALGVGKGVRTVYMNLIIPTYVPLEKLASASGLQMMTNGIFLFLGGPLIGLTRDMTEDYSMCIIIMNCVTMTTIIMWISEALVLRYRRKKALNDES